MLLRDRDRATHWDDRPCGRDYSSICEIP
jgi:hypothetical protein